MNPVHELASMGKSPQASAIEATSEARDAQVLARLGKKTVLEVEKEIAFTDSRKPVADENKASIRIHIDMWIYLHHSSDLGRISDVIEWPNWYSIL